MNKVTSYQTLIEQLYLVPVSQTADFLSSGSRIFEFFGFWNVDKRDRNCFSGCRSSTSSVWNEETGEHGLFSLGNVKLRRNAGRCSDISTDR